MPRNGPPVGNIIVSAPIRFVRLGNCIPPITSELANVYRDTGRDINIVNKPLALGADSVNVDRLDLGITFDPDRSANLGEAAEAVDIQLGEFTNEVEEAYADPEPDPGSFSADDEPGDLLTFGAAIDDFTSRVSQTSFVGYLATVELPAGDGACPIYEFDVALLGTLRLDSHCEIVDTIADVWGAVMWIAWSILSIRILAYA